MRLDRRQPVARIAADLPGAMRVFESFGVDYACSGDLSIDEASWDAGADPEAVLSSLRRLPALRHAMSWNERSVADLTHYLSRQHHRFVRDELASLAMRLAAVCNATEPVSDDVHALRAAFTRLSDMLLPHLQREEESLFGAADALERAWQSGTDAAVEIDVAAAVRDLVVEHAAIADELRRLRALRLRLASSDDLPRTGMALLDAVALLEAHLREYMFLENYILFPRAVALEAETAAAVTVS